METYVYIDLLFLLNFIMDLIIIRLAGRLLGRGAKIWRSAAGAVFAAGCASFFVFWSGILGIAIGSAGILGGLAIAYAPIKTRAFLRLAVSAYILTAALGGGCLAAHYMLMSVGMADGITIWLLTAAAVMVTMAIRYIAYRSEQRIIQMSNVNVHVSLHGRKTDFTALVDTGHSLREPISGKPVIVADFTAVKVLLPDEIKRLFAEKSEDDLEQAATAFQSAGFANRLRLLPYVSVGKRSGMLIGFRPDGTTVGGLDRDVIVAVYNGCLSDCGEYAALVGAGLMEE